MTALIVSLALIVLPGLIWAHLDRKFASGARSENWFFVGRAFVFGLTSYTATYGVYGLLGWPFEVEELTRGSQGTGLSQQAIDEIVVALTLTVPLSVIWLMAKNRKWVPRALRWLGATNKYGDEDLWAYLMNSDEPAVRFVNVRDFANKVVYSGYTQFWSEEGDTREIVLTEVIMYNSDTGQELQKMAHVYLARPKDQITLEFPMEGFK